MFTVHPGDDKYVVPDIQKIVEIGQKHKVGLILFGSFAKGEGCVINGKPRNDYDLLMMGNYEAIKEEIEKAVPLAEVHVITEAQDIPPTQQWYEIKYGSMPLTGRIEVRDIAPYEIPYSDAINSLERRSVSMILGRYLMLKENPNYRTITEQICKGIIALGDAVLIKRGEFSPSYRTRALMLMSDEIGRLYQMAVSLKLLNEPQLNPDEVWNLWWETRNRMRQYCADNQIELTAGNLLFDITERTTKEELLKVLEALKVDKRWL